MGCLELREHIQRFGSSQFPLEIGVGGGRIAMLAVEVAAPDQIPDDDRAGRLARRGNGTAIAQCFHESGQAEHGDSLIRYWPAAGAGRSS
ncbi:hypothetical protein D3C72_2397930 [compost metagenome]